MFCPKCGNTLPDNATFCNNCGTAMNNPPQQQYYQQPVRGQANKKFHFGFNSMVTGIVLKAIALTYLLYKFIYGIVQASRTASAYYGSYSSYISGAGSGSFAVFLGYFFEGLIMCAIVYGIAEVVERIGND